MRASSPSTDCARSARAESRELRRIVERWLSWSFAPRAAADRANVEATLLEAHSALGLVPPAIVAWSGSPHGSIRARYVWRRACAEVGDLVLMMGSSTISPEAVVSRARRHWRELWLNPAWLERSALGEPPGIGAEFESLAPLAAAFAATETFETLVLEERRRAQRLGRLIEAVPEDRQAAEDGFSADSIPSTADLDPDRHPGRSPLEPSFGSEDPRVAALLGEIPALWRASSPARVLKRSRGALQRLNRETAACWDPLYLELAIADARIGSPSKTGTESLPVELPIGPGDAYFWAIAESLTDVRRVEEARAYTTLSQAMARCGFCWLRPGIAFVSEPPVAVRRDDAGNLYDADGPALVFPDGWVLHASHGEVTHLAGFGSPS